MFELLRGIEHKALLLRQHPPPSHLLHLDDTRVTVNLPVERPLFRPSRTTDLDAVEVEAGEGELDVAAIDAHVFIDRQALADRVHRALGVNTSARLTDVVAAAPIEHGLAELIGYFSLELDDLHVEFDDDARDQLRWPDGDAHRLVEFPAVTFTRSNERSSA